MKDEEIARETMVEIGALLPSPWTPKGESEVISLLQAAFAKRKCPECAVLRTLSCVHGNKMDVCDICLGKPEAPAEASELCSCYTYMDGDTDPDCPMHGTHGKSILRSKPEAPADNVKAVLQKALDESIELQSHYAKLLNQYDGGKRIGFKDSVAWIMRLREIGVLTSVPDATVAHPAPVNPTPPAPVSPQLPSGIKEIASKFSAEASRDPNCVGIDRQAALHSYFYRAMKQAVEAAQKETNEERYTATKYFELIYAVESKYEGESRHQTALRYIQDRERRPIDQCGSTEKANP